MSMPFTNLIDAAELAALGGNVRILDCRAKLGELDWGYQQYLDGHIQGAQFVDLDRDLAAAPGAGGRHPLPEQEAWIMTIQQLGIRNMDQVVVYDDSAGAFAARAWWMFRWAGHAGVAVLNGGLTKWQGTLASGPASMRPRSDFSAGDPLTRIVTVQDIQDNDYSLIDARSHARWAGREEPIDPIAGHIPSAVCLPFQDNLNDEGRFAAAEKLRARFADLDSPVVCYCGSGVTAAHNILAMHVAGLVEPYLYPGSWSEWITDPARPIGTKD